MPIRLFFFFLFFVLFSLWLGFTFWKFFHALFYSRCMYFFQFAQINKRTKIVSRSQHTKTFSIKILAQKANQTKANQAKSKAVRSTENVSHIEFEYFEHSIISFPSPWHSDFDSDSDSPALDSIPFFAKIYFVCCILLYFKCSCVPVLAANIYGPVN